MKVIGTQHSWRRATAAAAFALSLGLCALAGHSGERSVSAPADPAEQLCRQTLSSFGWEVSALVSRESVTLPGHPDATYREYLALQEEVGLPLASCAGKTVTRYTFRVENYPTGEAPIYADLLVCQREVVGGDIRSASLDGFMSSLRYPKAGRAP